MPRVLWVLCLSSLFFAQTSSAVSPILSIVPSMSSTTLRSDSETSITYTVTNNASVPVTGLQINAGYKTTGNAADFLLQNDSCTGTTLASGTSCTFGLIISGSQQPSQFFVTPEVTGNGGQVRSTTGTVGRLTVNVYLITSPVYAYYGQHFSNTNFGILPISVVPPYASGNSITNLHLSSNLESRASIAVSLDGAHIYAAEVPNAGNSADIAVLSSGNVPVLMERIVLPGVTEPINGGFFIAITPDGSSLYLSVQDFNDLFVVDLSTSQVTPISGVFSDPIGITIKPDGSQTYVVNETGGDDNLGSISVIDTVTNQVIKTIDNNSLGTSALYSPTQAVISPDGETLYVANQGSDVILVINITNDTDLLSYVVDTPGSIQGLSLSNDGNILYATTIMASVVYAINIITNDIDTININNPGGGLALTPDSTSLFVTPGFDFTDSTVNVISGLPASQNVSPISLDGPKGVQTFGAFVN